MGIKPPRLIGILLGLVMSIGFLLISVAAQDNCAPDGDVNDDHVHTPADARLALQAFLGVPLTPCEQARANVDSTNSAITPADTLCILAQYLGRASSCLASREAAPQILGPVANFLSNESMLEVSGTVPVAVLSVTVDGVEAVLEGSVFTASQVPLREGNNIITVVTEDIRGRVSTASVQVTLDTTPPRVAILTPGDDTVVTTPTITVTGMINDVVVGTVNGEQGRVTVNGLEAEVANRNFMVTEVPLVPGRNVLTVVGMDQAGNMATAQVTVTFDAMPGVPQIHLVSGNNQSGAIGTPLSAPLVVSLTDGAGAPVAGEMVIFRVRQSNGTLTGDMTGMGVSAVMSNAAGQGEVMWTLGNRAGAGNNVVEATAVGFAGSAVFTAMASPGEAAHIVVDAGNNQVGVVGQPLPHPLIAVVTDEGHNRLGNVPVTFTVSQGGGSFNGQSSLTVNTDSDGRALATFILGPESGFDNHMVTADFAGNTAMPVVFVASGRIAGDPSATRLHGVVLDNSNLPIPGVTIRLLETTFETRTDAQGQFVLEGVPVGEVLLLADGRTAERPGTWPTLEFELVTIAGQNNTLGMPIYLLPLDMPNAIFVDAQSGGTLTLPQVPGFSLTVLPGSATFPGGSTAGEISVTVVHPDKIPMLPNFGQQPRFVVTVQPPGVLFNPPAPFTLPNADGLAPREVVELYSFDHDMGQFVSIGTGTVSNDGTIVRSDPGVGIIKGGWHCGGNPAPFGTCEHECDDSNACTTDRLVNGMCEHTPLPNGMDCSQGNMCLMNAMCMDGMCQATPNLNVMGSEADRNTFLALLMKCGRRDNIGNLCDPNIDANVGRNNGFIDAFNAKTIDLTDLEAVAGDNPCPSASDECQNLAHILGERANARANGCMSAADPCFMDAHHAGWAAENAYRRSQGQAGAVLSDSNCPGVDFCIRYDDDGDGMEDRRVEWDLDGGRIVSRKCVP